MRAVKERSNKKPLRERKPRNNSERKYKKKSKEIEPNKIEDSKEDFVTLNNTEISFIPKIIHRIWMVFDPKNSEIPQKYNKLDEILRSLHPDWIFMEWDDKKVLNFVYDYYPDFYQTYISYAEPVMRHDVSRYLILKHFGGVFIQHSFVFQKNIQPLLGSYELVFSTKFDYLGTKESKEREGELANGWMASIPNHPFWDYLIPSLISRANQPMSKERNWVMSLTGPFILTEALNEYQREKHDESINVLNYKYLMPFYALQRNDIKIKNACIDSIEVLDFKKCFTIFPRSYAYTPWEASWTLKKNKKSPVDLSLLDTNSLKPLYTKLFVMNLKRSPDR